uniref:Large ribosomal subunit protein mL45 n=1 Tax=Steinernema glaseri TaxID=37863 RepID=A0A1I8A289_9BILA
MLSRLSAAGPLPALLRATSCGEVATQKCEVHHHKERGDLQRFIGMRRSNPSKANRNTHHNERMFRAMRGQKTLTMELPDDEVTRQREKMTPAEIRLDLLRRGINPYKDVSPRGWNENQATLNSFYAVVDPYVSPEDPLPFVDLSNPMTTVKMKGSETWERVLHRWHNYKNGVSRIRKKEGFEKFDPKTWGPTADDIYVRAHEALMARDKAKLHRLITENAFTKMWPDVENGSIVWEMVGQNEPSKVVSVRCADSPYKSGNDIAQLTVRMNTKQRLAVYDRFGKLLLGSEAEVRDCVEYVVFENHIANIDGMWRLHDKVYPKWVKTKTPAAQTRMLQSDEERPSTTLSLPLRAEVIDKERRKAERAGKKAEDEE